MLTPRRRVPISTIYRTKIAPGTRSSRAQRNAVEGPRRNVVAAAVTGGSFSYSAAGDGGSYNICLVGQDSVEPPWLRGTSNCPITKRDLESRLPVKFRRGQRSRLQISSNFSRRI